MEPNTAIGGIAGRVSLASDAPSPLEMLGTSLNPLNGNVPVPEPSPSDPVDDWKLAEYLEPVDRLLRQLSQIEPPECPDGLCKRTLDRCKISAIGG